MNMLTDPGTVTAQLANNYDNHAGLKVEKNNANFVSQKFGDKIKILMF